MKVSDIIIWERNFWYKIENNGKKKSFTARGIEKQNSNLFSGHQLAQIFLTAMKYESYIKTNTNLSSHWTLPMESMIQKWIWIKNKWTNIELGRSLSQMKLWIGLTNFACSESPWEGDVLVNWAIVFVSERYLSLKWVKCALNSISTVSSSA